MEIILVLRSLCIKLESKTIQTPTDFTMWSMEHRSHVYNVTYNLFNITDNPNGPYVLKDFCLSRQLILNVSHVFY